MSRTALGGRSLLALFAGRCPAPNCTHVACENRGTSRERVGNTHPPWKIACPVSFVAAVAMRGPTRGGGGTQRSVAEGPARLARTAQRAQRACYARSTAVRQAMTSHQARPPRPSRSAPPRAGPRSSTKVGGTWAVGVQRTVPACPTFVSGAWAISGLRRRCLFPRLGRPAPSLPTLSFPLLQRQWQHLFWRLPGASSPVSPLPPRD